MTVTHAENDATYPMFLTNQTFVEGIRTNSLNLEDIDSVFRYVFSNLHDTVTVYPTENYYYFRFYTNGVDVWGNIRLDSIDRDQGEISFAYFPVSAYKEQYYSNSDAMWHKPYGEKDGVLVKKIDALTYSVTANGRTVTFRLNDLPQTLPEGLKTYPTETFVARTFDESGFQLVMLYDTNPPAFRFVLDETAPIPDQLNSFGEDIVVGQLSGFAFYQEPGMDRKVFFGVDEHNVTRNSYYDGPFDQLADNFIDPAVFERQVLSVFPSLEGKMKGRGDFVDEEGNRISSRVLISPYISYDELRDIWVHIAACQQAHTEDQHALTSCITLDPRMAGRE